MIDLLTIEEAIKLPVEILQCKAHKDFNGFINNKNKCNWWLSSPGYDRRIATAVGASGTIYANGNYVQGEHDAVRPALRIEESLIKALPRTKKGYVIYLNTKWIDISDYLGYPCLLKKKCMKEAHNFDGKSNNYDQSEVKDFIEKWYRRKEKKHGKE